MIHIYTVSSADSQMCAHFQEADASFLGGCLTHHRPRASEREKHRRPWTFAHVLQWASTYALMCMQVCRLYTKLSLSLSVSLSLSLSLSVSICLLYIYISVSRLSSLSLSLSRSLSLCLSIYIYIWISLSLSFSCSFCIYKPSTTIAKQSPGNLHEIFYVSLSLSFFLCVYIYLHIHIYIYLSLSLCLSSLSLPTYIYI